MLTNIRGVTRCGQSKLTCIVVEQSKHCHNPNFGLKEYDLTIAQALADHCNICTVNYKHLTSKSGVVQWYDMNHHTFFIM